MTHFLDFVEESDQPGNSSQPYQAEDPHKHQNSHHFVGLGGVVIVVVVQILEYKDEKKKKAPLMNSNFTATFESFLGRGFLQYPQLFNHRL